eukprot:scaffold58548_cov73-Phaeocystis_antarctica.AAC.3
MSVWLPASHSAWCSACVCLQRGDERGVAGEVRHQPHLDLRVICRDQHAAGTGHEGLAQPHAHLRGVR